MADFPQGCAVLFGASGGLGQAIARRMAELGADQVLTYHRNREATDALAAEITAGGGKASAMQCDISDLASVQAVIDQAAKDHGRIHSVINCAGGVYSFHQMANLDPDAFRTVLDTDVVGFFNIAKAAAPPMRQAGGGSIVTVGSAGIAKTTQGNGLSCIPKAAVAMMVRLMAMEEGRKGIRVNFVGAGIMHAGMSLVMEAKDDVGNSSLDTYAKQATGLRRTGGAEELADTVAYLASDRASYVTGQIIHVDGGLSA